MNVPVFPTIEALRSLDEGRLDFELRLAAIRMQSAVVRTLLDEIDRVADGRLRAPLAQLADEIARLGCTAFEAASLVAPKAPDRESSTLRPWGIPIVGALTQGKPATRTDLGRIQKRAVIATSRGVTPPRR